ncbi:MAG: ribosome hibernation-promoting factor, HPF/YfiA family [Bacteroidia bacterium]
MNIKIQSIHFDADKKLIEFVTNKIEKLEHYYDRILDATIYLKLNNHRTKDNKHVEVKLNISHNTLFKEAEANSFEAAADMVLEALKIQLKKQKELLLEKS